MSQDINSATGDSRFFEGVVVTLASPFLVLALVGPPMMLRALVVKAYWDWYAVPIFGVRALPLIGAFGAGRLRGQCGRAP